MLTFSTQRYDFALNCTKTPNCVEVYDPGLVLRKLKKFQNILENKNGNANPGI
jgi:hypothetical protein